MALPIEQLLGCPETENVLEELGRIADLFGSYEQMVEATLESGKTLRADALLYCIGRQGATDELSLDLLSPAVRERRSAGSAAQAQALAENPGDIRAAVADLEKRSIEAALAQSGGNKSKAAGLLGISRFALQRKLDKYELGTARKDEGGGREEELEEETTG